MYKRHDLLSEDFLIKYLPNIYQKSIFCFNANEWKARVEEIQVLSINLCNLGGSVLFVSYILDF